MQNMSTINISTIISQIFEGKGFKKYDIPIIYNDNETIRTFLK